MRYFPLSFPIFLIMLLVCGCGEPEKPERPEEKTDPDGPAVVDAVPENFVKVETPGTYTYMATSANKSGGETVSIAAEYYICKWAVTNADWKKYVDEAGASAPKYWNGKNIPEGREKHPVLWISCSEAEAYCKWLSDKTQGWTFRLPTQPEWEFAAAGTERKAYPWGDQAGATYSGGVLTSKFNYNAVIAAEVLKNPDRMATYNNSKSTRYGQQDKISDIISVSATGGVTGWVDHTNYLGFIYTDIFTEINDAGGNTCPVDAYPEGASWCGCLNMCGNCWEWTSTIETAQNGAEKGQDVNVIRGGSWYANASSCKASFRGEGRKASSAYNTVGFRLVAEKK
ncbi:MAG: SUMF1/EgtB/PvdO family nonheme iron enzyme [Bacteroidales bacterium]|nr:SUMF1/EgtB/PvdO family nonheme iron enzyme [Bacteroidales bacterium]